MKTGFLGIDTGSISTKGVIIDEDNHVVAEKYIWTEGNPIKAVKKLIKELENQVAGEDGEEKIKISAGGTTGSARRLAGAMISADVIKNEITAHAVGTLAKYPDVRTIFEIGGQDSKIILIEDGIVVDYAMNTLCAAGTGSFLSSQAKRMGMDVEDFGDFALQSRNPTKIAARCTVFAESDLVHKAQSGYKREDIIAGLCKAVVTNYLNNVGKGKTIKAPIVFQGGVSKNTGVIKAFEEATGEKIYVDPHAHLMGAIGAAILAKNSVMETRVHADHIKHKSPIEFKFEIADLNFETKGMECNQCANNCEIICFYKDNGLIDAWGNRCEKGCEAVQ